MESSLQTLVDNVGFPIAISMYLLVRIEGKLNSLTDSINKLSNNINIIMTTRKTGGLLYAYKALFLAVLLAH